MSDVVAGNGAPAGTGDGVTASTPKLNRSMGLWMAIALVIGNMVGSGVFLLPSSLAAAAGPVSIIGWVFTGVGAMLLAFCFAKLGGAFPRTGGPYAYARRAFGDFIGFQTAWGYWIAAWAGNAAITVAFVGYLSVFWTQLGDGDHNLLAALVGIGVIWFLTAVNSLGIRQGAQVQVVTTVLKFVPLVIIGVVGLFFIDGDNYKPFAPDGTWSAISAAAPLTLWAFIGLESATVAAEEVKDPKRNIPRATMYGTLVTTIVYIVTTVAIMGVVSQTALADSSSPFALAAGEMFGGSWDKVIALVAMVATFGALNGWIILQARIPLAAAEDGLFPKQFAKVSGERRTPVFGLVVSSVLVSGLMLMNYTKGLVDAFTFIILLATLTTLIPYAYSAAAQVNLYFTEPGMFERKSFIRDTAIATLAFAYSVWAITGSGKDIIAKGFVLLLAGIPIYVLLKAYQARQADREARDLLGAGPPPTPAEAKAAAQGAAGFSQ